jgi:methionine-gamma-lyase
MEMSMNKNHELETKIIHWGHEPDPTTGSLASPIYQTATFAAKSVEHFEELCMNWGYVYSRECNPTLTELEAKLAMLGQCRKRYLKYIWYGCNNIYITSFS